MNQMQLVRAEAAAAANAVDAALWRWLSALLDERRIRWCQTTGNWLVSVDNRHVATQRTFDEAIRMAKANSECDGPGWTIAFPTSSRVPLPAPH
ncbi:hypothetical protein [Burkholderia sp. A9]|uniref:hypothetical protein n=1 Tax=Burkholderia sp. A9 TaxID=1365108 RepID=UPI001F46A1EB|nr:hypothetical protein [Burkholderia sp. A9]